MFLQFFQQLFCFFLHVGETGSFRKPLRREEEQACFEALAAGDRSAREKLILHNMRLVAHVIKKYGMPQPEQEELISIGTVGLVKAVDSFDCTKGARFATYASKCINNEILMNFRSQKKHADQIYMGEPIETDGDGNQLYGLGIPTAKVTYSGAALNGILYAYGGRFVDENGNVDIVSDANIAVFQMLKELTDEMVIPSVLEIKDLRGMFASGTLGMIVDSDAALATFRSASGQGKAFDEKISVCTIPIGATGRSETVYTEHQLTVYAKSEKKEAAIKLVEFLISRDAMVKYHAACAILSPRASIATLPEMNEDAFTETFNRQSLTASPLPASNPMFDNAMNEMTKAMERVIIGGEDIKSVLEETQQTIAELYDRY